MPSLITRVLKHKLFFPVLVAIYLLARLSLINVNSAEWGDSYRILRASNYIQNLTYPIDEKRPPLFSIVLAIRPSHIDAVIWGRLIMLVISLGTLFLFYKLTELFLTTQNQRRLALALLALNPIYLYWSLRIYADVPFSFLVLLCFYVLEKWRKKLATTKNTSIKYPIIIGLTCGLSILTRFEGYLLILAVCLGLCVTTTVATIKRIRFISLVVVIHLV